MRTRVPVAVLLVAAASAPLAAQTAPAANGRYFSIGDAATPWVEHLIRAGVLPDPDPLTRPLRRADVARALAAVDTTLLSVPLVAAVRDLLAELAPPPDSATWSVTAFAGALAASDARRDPVRPAAESTGVFPRGGLALALELPRLTLVTAPFFDNRLKYDPDYRGKKDRVTAGRFAEAYVDAAWRYFGAFFGSVDRNWGSPETDGLLLSANPYSLDHLALRFGPPRLRVELIAAQLDPLPLWNTVQPVNRYLAMHRLVVQPSARLALSLSESAVYAQTGGIPRSFELWYLNPLNVFLVSQYDGATTANVLLAADALWRPRGTLRLYGHLYLDDFQVDDQSPSDQEPPGYGFTLSASGGAGRGRLSWSLLYTRVTNLAYRTPANEEQYSVRGVGIGRNYADYDQATARLTAVPAGRLLAGLELTALRQGEGDFRLQYPADSLFPQTPTIFDGVVERTLRVAASARWTPWPDVQLAAELGRHDVRNAAHVSGADGDRWVWRLLAVVRRRWGGAVPW